LSTKNKKRRILGEKDKRIERKKKRKEQLKSEMSERR
jgi:hypothetical protein